MDVNRLRATYIQRELGHALTASDISKAAAAAREFRRYSQWYANSLPANDKETIAERLSELELKISHTCRPDEPRQHH